VDNVERIGSGVRRMRELMSEANLKDPVFDSSIFFNAIFYKTSDEKNMAEID